MACLVPNPIIRGFKPFGGCVFSSQGNKLFALLLKSDVD